ncbi:MAG: DUF362 domain-containing protein [Candidatus Aminicenantes bacterium]|nr:DUF362 domain-containing protein [Candidatus Aminicenantes bacterium]
MKRKEIVLIKETRQNEFVKKVMDTIAPYITLKASDKVAIKIDLSGSREIYSNTHYETVESLICYLKDHFDVSDISVIEGSDGAYYSGKTTWDIFYKFRYKEVELNGAKLVNLDELPHEHEMNVYTISGMKTVKYAKFDADYTITVVPPKTHNIFPVALSIPNIIGYVRPEDRTLMYGAPAAEMRKISFSTSDKLPQLIVNAGKNFAGLFRELQPSLTLIDGLYGMEGKGPIKGSPVFHGFAIASEDTVLADSLTTYIMGFDVDEISYIYYAYREGLGNNRWQNVIGVDPPVVKFPYRPHPFYPRQKLWRNINNNRRDNKPHGSNKHYKTQDRREHDRNDR